MNCISLTDKRHNEPQGQLQDVISICIGFNSTKDYGLKLIYMHFSIRKLLVISIQVPQWLKRTFIKLAVVPTAIKSNQLSKYKERFIKHCRVRAIFPMKSQQVENIARCSLHSFRTHAQVELQTPQAVNFILRCSF